jgi:hypothetical protein
VNDQRTRRGISLSRGWVIGGAVTLLVVVAAGGWVLVRGREARTALAQLQIDGTDLRDQLTGYDLAAAGPSLTKVRLDAARAHQLTGDPVWGLAGSFPVLGRNLRAARQVSAVLANITTAARPMETALPLLDPTRSSAAGGRIDTVALSSVAQALPGVSSAVTAGAVTIGQLDPAGLTPQIGSGVSTLNDALAAARTPLAGAVPMIRMVPAMLGADGRRSWLVLLQQDAEARGTGGLVGAYAVMNTDHGQITLVSAQSRHGLDRGPAIPAGVVPAGLGPLYGHDLNEWAGFNASPNFPFTGQLVAAGWKARPGTRPLSYVVGVDQYVVAALLAATGPVTVRGVTVNQDNAVAFLSRDVYAHWKNPQLVDSVTTELVETVFSRFTVGRFDLRALVTAIREPVRQRRLLVWSAKKVEQRQILPLGISGALPAGPGPFAMAVINNGGGNKLDAYLKVHTDYQGGECTNGTRVGQIAVTLTNTAPRSGLPAYVNVRTDRLQLGYTGAVTHDGSNRLILNVYGPVSSSAALTTVDGVPLVPVVGIDSNHTVWRVPVQIKAGQRLTVNIVMSTPAVDGDVGSSPVVLSQPMVMPATVSSRPLSACQNSSTTRG